MGRERIGTEPLVAIDGRIAEDAAGGGMMQQTADEVAARLRQHLQGVRRDERVVAGRQRIQRLMQMPTLA